MGPSQISDTQIGCWCLWILYIYIYIYYIIHVAVSCKRYPPSLPYIIIVQTCGKRWDLPKFVDVLSVNLGFSQSLIYTRYHIRIFKHVHHTPWEDLSMGYPFYLAAYHLKVVPRGHFSDTWLGNPLFSGHFNGRLLRKKWVLFHGHETTRGHTP